MRTAAWLNHTTRPRFSERPVKTRAPSPVEAFSASRWTLSTWATAFRKAADWSHEARIGRFGGAGQGAGKRGQTALLRRVAGSIVRCHAKRVRVLALIAKEMLQLGRDVAEGVSGGSSG